MWCPILIKLSWCSALALAVVGSSATAEDGAGIRWPRPDKTLTLAKPYHGSDIVLRLSSRTAGAIDSLIWNGTEFINSYDHGRQLQSAVSFDDNSECLNPTEAGSAADGLGTSSRSRLEVLRYGADWIETRTRMAWWLKPGESNMGCPRGPGPYRSLRSDHRLIKRITLGLPDMPNVIVVHVTFHLPRSYRSANFEALTAYLPPAFSNSWLVDPGTGTLTPLPDGPGDSDKPVILATIDAKRALGVWSPGPAHPGDHTLRFGWWKFLNLPGPGNATTKWNCDFRAENLPPGPRDYTCYAVVGTLDEVRAGITALAWRQR